MLAPPPQSAALPGIGGRLRARPEDFRVDEIPAYGPDGRGDRHLLVRFEKTGLPTMAAVGILAEACGVAMADVGVAGRKDADAVTRQWISLPVESIRPLQRFEHEAIRVLEAHPHGQKLRTGHLHGNRFEIVVRDLAVPISEARTRVADKLGFLKTDGGLDNLFGPQRFGAGGSNLERGLEALTARRLDRRDRFVASAAQSGLFNLYVHLRREAGWMQRVLVGDLLRKTASGGLFFAEDVDREQERLEDGEIEITGPIHGARTRRPPDGTPSAELEEEVLRRVGLDPADLGRHGKRLPGSRRACQLGLEDVEVDQVPGVEGLGEGLRLRFALRPGSFATQLTRELQCGPDTEDPLDALAARGPSSAAEDGESIEEEGE